MNRDRRTNFVLCFAWQLFVLVAIASVPSSWCQDFTLKACPGESKEPVVLNLTCPEGRQVRPGEAVFGKNKYGLCTLTEDDCKEKANIFFNSCLGLDQCLVTMDKFYSPACGYVTFVSVSFVCEAAPIMTSTSSAVEVTTSLQKDKTTLAAEGFTGRQVAENQVNVNKPDDNIGLIVGCVVAVVITVILLIIAITLVIRRLTSTADTPEDGDGKKTPDCQMIPCVAVEKSDLYDVDDDPNQSPDVKLGKRKRSKNRLRGTDKNQNMAPRLAPVGQEDEPASSCYMEPKMTDHAPKQDYPDKSTSDMLRGPEVKHSTGYAVKDKADDSSSTPQVHPGNVLPYFAASPMNKTEVPTSRASFRCDAAVGLPNTEAATSC